MDGILAGLEIVMANSRSISPEAWAHAQESLIFYFSRRHARADAEDLAQETLLAIWNREDYEFDKEEDFLRVCYGFARHISKEGYRETVRHAGVPLDPSLPMPQHEWSGARATESRILLEKVCEIGRSQLHEKDWQIIEQAADIDRATMAKEFNMGDANNVRVRLHRARRKLAKLTGHDES
jgi:DNA-directed RNA polymerase specialized sigma24 family protein